MLVVGAGSSAFDIGRDIAFVADKVYQSDRHHEETRSEHETLFEETIRSVVPENVVRIAEIREFKPVNDTDSMMHAAEIVLKDGTILTGIDCIVFCTGYRFSLPFMPHRHRSLQQVNPTTARKSAERKDEDENAKFAAIPIITDGLQLHNLYHDIFYIPDPTLAFTGVKYEISSFPLFDIQAVCIAQVFSGRAALLSVAEMTRCYNEQLRLCGPGKQFHVLGWKKEMGYMHALANLTHGNNENNNKEKSDTTAISTDAAPRKGCSNQDEDIEDLLRHYSSVLQSVRQKHTEAFREFLLKTTKFRNMDDEAVRVLIEKKVEGIAMRLKLLDAGVVAGASRAADAGTVIAS